MYISVIHPEIDDLVNHKAKLAVESHLINSRLDWTVLRPQHYMQNILVARVIDDVVTRDHTSGSTPALTMSFQCTSRRFPTVLCLGRSAVFSGATLCM